MQDYLSMPFGKRKKIVQKIKQKLFERKEVIFAYIFGSFIDAPSFRDIDIAIYLKNIKKEDIFDLEFALADELSEVSRLPTGVIEIKIINFAPLIFQNTIFRQGQLLFYRNEKLLTDLIEQSSLEAIANEHIGYQSLQELVPV